MKSLKKYFAPIVALAIAVISTFSASAEAFSAPDVGNAISSGFGGVANDMTGMITTILPIGLGIIGAVLAVKFGIKFFKGLTNK